MQAYQGLARVASPVAGVGNLPTFLRRGGGVRSFLLRTRGYKWGGSFALAKAVVCALGFWSCMHSLCSEVVVCALTGREHVWYVPAKRSIAQRPFVHSPARARVHFTLAVRFRAEVGAGAVAVCRARACVVVLQGVALVKRGGGR